MAVRVDLYREAIKAVTDRPLLGHGAGTYSSIEPLYHGAGTPSDLAWSNAHSTILEAFACLGIPATLFALIIGVYALGSLAKAWRSASPDAICTVSCLASAIAIAVHALVDFSLEIQAIALYSACLLGLATGEIMRLQRKTASSH
jgi:O-antigen ligase